MIKKKFINYYKVFIQYLFKILYGKIDGVLDPIDHKEIYQEDIIVEELNYKLYNCKKAVLYTDTIHDTAIIKDNKIIEGPSFQYRENIIEKSLKNTVLAKGTPRFRKKIKGSVYSFLVGGGGNTNYWHWLFDVLPKFFILKNSISFNSNNFFLFPSLEKKFQNQTLDIIGINQNKRLSSKIYRHIEADEIITVSHPYNFLNDPDKDSLNIPIWIFKFLKTTFLKNSLNNFNLKKIFPKKIFISRKDGTSLRYIINEKEVKVFLTAKGYEEVILSNYDFKDQVFLFNNAEIIVGLHGAGFANIIFCKPKMKIIELRPVSAGEIIKNIALRNDLDYYDMAIPTKKINFNNQAGDIEVDLKILSELVK